MQFDKSDKNLLIIVSVFVLMTISMVVLSFYGNRVLSGARGYIAGEGQWAKAQKQAVLELIQFSISQDSRHYVAFYEHLKVIQGDRDGRDAILLSDKPDFQRGYDGYKQGRLLDFEIGPMLWMLNRFHNQSFMQEAIGYWEAGDDKIDELIVVAEELHDLIQRGEFHENDFHRLLQQMYRLDHELTILEDNFSITVREAANQIGNITIWLTLFIMISLFLAGGYITAKYYRESSAMNRKLTAAELKFRNVLENSQDIIYQMDIDCTRYEYVSPSIEKFTGYTPEEVIDCGPEFILNNMHPDDRESTNNELDKFTRNPPDQSGFSESEFRLKTKKGDYIWLSNKRSLIRNQDGEPVAIVGNVRDISDKIRYLEEINKSLKEKDTLLAEIHHRVKNNLAIVSSLIELQREEPIESRDQLFDDLRSRIQSIALVHEKLYRSEDFSEILLSDYFKELTNYISDTYKSRNSEISVTFDLDPVRLNITKAVPLGLLYNELINNVYKHAFNGRDRGAVHVSLKSTNGNNGMELMVTDDGVGLSEDWSIDDSTTLGMTLIRTLTAQLRGKMDIRNNGETTFHFMFTDS